MPQFIVIRFQTEALPGKADFFHRTESENVISKKWIFSALVFAAICAAPTAGIAGDGGILGPLLDICKYLMSTACGGAPP